MATEKKSPNRKGKRAYIRELFTILFKYNPGIGSPDKMDGLLTIPEMFVFFRYLPYLMEGHMGFLRTYPDFAEKYPHFAKIFERLPGIDEMNKMIEEGLFPTDTQMDQLIKEGLLD